MRAKKAVIHLRILVPIQALRIRSLAMTMVWMTICRLLVNPNPVDKAAVANLDLHGLVIPVLIHAWFVNVFINAEPLRGGI
jgi:hypothetical protein